jgi:hypothetical protein
VVSPDETGWRVDGKRGWLWAYVGDHVTVYDIAVGRGYDEAKAILGEDYDGVICRDGWAPYRRFTQAEHQSCFAHLIRRCSEMIADSAAGQARIPHALRRLLGDALDLRDRRDDGQGRGRSWKAPSRTCSGGPTSCWRLDLLMSPTAACSPTWPTSATPC